MDFRLDDDQLALQESVRGFCRERWPLDRIAERDTGALDREGWRALLDLGVVSVMVDESAGGLGLGAVEGSVVFEQLGAQLAPGPLLWSTLGALLLPEIARGEMLAGGTEDHGQTPLFVEHARDVDVLVVLRGDGVACIDRGDLPEPERADALDPLSPVGVFESLPAGRTIGGADEAVRLRRMGTLLASALQLGIADAALEVSVAYSLEREQFGAPIGSFQALKHIMADMYVRVGLARSATYAAAAVLDDPGIGDAERALGAAKLLAGEAAVDNARAAIQIFGGMGFTWHMPPGFLLKRAWVLDQCFGSPTAHALSMADRLHEEVA